MKIFTISLLTAFLFSITINTIYAQRIMVTWVGGGRYNGDGLPGDSTQIGMPNDVCLDALHNLYFVDKHNSKIRKLAASTGLVSTLATVAANYMCVDGAGHLYVTTATRIIRINTMTGDTTIVAGTGVVGYSGDGGLAIAAKINNPHGICMDAAGTIYFVDRDNSRIRKITISGIISTIAGTGDGGYDGDGGLATSAKISSPVAICVDGSGNVYFSDQVSIESSYIREIYAVTGNMGTIAGTGFMASGDGGPAISAGVGGVYGMCADAAGNLFINDVSCSCREITMATGIINVVAGSLYSDGYGGDGEDALSGELNWPYGLFVDQQENIYIADGENNRIRKVLQLTHTPSFVYGKIQTIAPCPEIVFSLNNSLAITDLDIAQTETWSVISAPANGTLSGFPHSLVSTGPGGLTIPSGLSYTSAPGFSGTDSFKISVSDGALSDTITLYANPQYPSAGIISGASAGVCVGSFAPLIESVEGGTWSVTNSNMSGLTGVTAGTDTVIYTVTAACSSTTSAVITVKPLPDPGIITGPDSVCVGSSINLSETVEGGIWHTSFASGCVVSPLGVVTGVSTGISPITYRVTANGCAASNTDYITVPAPLDAIAGSANVCISSSITLSDPTAGGMWTLSNGNATLGSSGADFVVITGLTEGTVTAVYTDTNACGLVSVYKMITIDSPLEVGSISGTSMITAGTSTTLTDHTTGGLWSSTNTAISSISEGGIVLGIAAGLDSIAYSVHNSCGGSSTYFYFVVTDNKTGIINLGSNNDIDKLIISPNPAKEQATIQVLSFYNEQVIITLTDILGEKMAAITGITNQPMQIEQKLPTGIYLLNVTGAHVNLTGKLIKQ